ncbi:MAG: MFS transporter [Anaerolineae bacterium]|nr:MFS transporter [Anaerolineae bacterium]
MMVSMDSATRPRINPWVALAFIAIPVFIGSIDLTIVSAFLPEIIVSLELPVQSVIDDAAWIVTGYLLAYTISLIVMGRLSDLIGRRRAYVLCLIVFMIGSFIVAEVDPQARSGLSGALYNLSFRMTGARPDPGSIALTAIIIGRIVQALGAGAIVPVSLALVGDLFPANRRAQPFGVIGAIDTLGWVLGHLYGGVMVRWFADLNATRLQEGASPLLAAFGTTLPSLDWRMLFWINIPISLIGLALTWWALRGEPQTKSASRMDWLGAALISAALILLVVGLGANIEIASTAASFEDIGGLPPYAGPALGAALLLALLFVLVERRGHDPLFDIKMMRRRAVASGLAANLFVGFCLMIGLVSVPILVNVRIADPSFLSEAALQVGILLSALTVPMALAAVPGGWLSDRIGYPRTAMTGLLLALVGFVLIWQTWTLDVADQVIALEMMLVGVGLGLTFSPISASVINSADEDKLGVSSALVIIMRLLGMTLGVSSLTSFASQRLSLLAAAELGADFVDPYAAVDVYARLTVQVLAEIALLGAILCAIGLIPALLLRRRAEGQA